MRTSDLKVGTEYAYRRRSYSTPEQVKVLEVNVTQKVKVSAYRTETRTGLVKVEFVATGRIECIRPKTIQMTWEQHLAQEKASEETRKRREAESTVFYKKRADLAFSLHQRLLAAGKPVSMQSVYDDRHHEAVLAAGFTPVPETLSMFTRYGIFSALDDLSRVMGKGLVSVEDVALLAGLSEPEADEDSGLGGWDWDYIRAEQGDEAVDAFFAAYAEASTLDPAH